MNTPAPAPARQPTGKKGPAFTIGLLVAGLSTALLPSEARKLTPYLDSVGIPTACMGIIGKEVTRRYKAKETFTLDECLYMEKTYLTKMVTDMGHCIKDEIEAQMVYDQWIGLGHWAYNVGTRAFCNSGVVRKLNQGDFAGSCQAMGDWTYLTIGGKKVNCRDPKYKCGGIPKRRDYEVKTCMGALPA